MAPSPLVSIIVPTYNRRALLKEALAGVMAQTMPDFEVIVVNDAGADASATVAEFNDPRIVYLSHDVNQGQPAARNTALRAARGRYIAYLDDDDLYLPHHLETLVGALQASGKQVAYSDCVSVSFLPTDTGFKETERENVFHKEATREGLLIDNCFPPLVMVHERACLEKTGLFDVDLRGHEDWDLTIRLALHYEFEHVHQITAEYRNFHNNTRTIWHGQFLRMFQIVHPRYITHAADPATAEKQRLTRRNCARWSAHQLRVMGAAELLKLPKEAPSWISQIAIRLIEFGDNDSYLDETVEMLQRIQLLAPHHPEILRAAGHLERHDLW